MSKLEVLASLPASIKAQMTAEELLFCHLASCWAGGILWITVHANHSVSWVSERGRYVREAVSQ